MESRRQKRVESLIQEALSRHLILDLGHMTTDLVTVTRVEITADLKTARVYLSIYGDADKSRILEHLEKRTGHYRKVLASQVKLKYNPMLFFEIDPTPEYEERIDRLLEITKKDGRHGS
jgi:ribosome-binding factor A